MTAVPEDVTNQDTVYALAAAASGVCFCGRMSGLYRSGDRGATWQPALSGGTPLLAAAVALSPEFELDPSVFAGAPGGVLRSTNAGQTWEVAALPPPPPFILTLAVSPDYRHDGTVLAGTMEDGVFRSADRGRTWAAWNFGLLDLHVLCLAISPDFNRDEVIYAGTESGIFRSTTGGRAWREIPFPEEAAPVVSLALSPDYAASGGIYAGTESQGLFFSGDRGQTWRRVGEDAAGDEVLGILAANGQASEQSGPDVLIVRPGGLRISRDGGQTWAEWPGTLPAGRDLTAVAAPNGIGPGAPLLVGLSDGGVLWV